MDIRIYNHLILILGVFCITVVLAACSSFVGHEKMMSDRKKNSVALRLAVPELLKNNFCAKFEVSAADMQTIIMQQYYPANSLFIDTEIKDIQTGVNRKLTLGLFEDRICGELDDAEWLGNSQDIPVNVGDATRVSLNLVNMTTGTIITSSQF